MFPPHPDAHHDPDGLRQALSRLPEHSPQAGTWATIQARAVARRRTRQRLRRMLPLAAAASLLLALGLPTLLDQDATPPGTQTATQPTTLHTVQTSTPAIRHATSTTQTAPATLAALQSRSMRMEQWLSELRAGGAPLQGPALARAVDLQDRIGLVDLQLSAPSDAAARKTLWQQRVNLLQDLAMLRVSQSPVSDQHAMAESRGAALQL
ncbi:hypothetical protein HNQ86_001473 [Oleiagrimonas soli]|nr:hypothetical protein [Oleiagrimonas soli]